MAWSPFPVTELVTGGDRALLRCWVDITAESVFDHGGELSRA